MDGGKHSYYSDLLLLMLLLLLTHVCMSVTLNPSFFECTTTMQYPQAMIVFNLLEDKMFIGGVHTKQQFFFVFGSRLFGVVVLYFRTSKFDGISGVRLLLGERGCLLGIRKCLFY